MGKAWIDGAPASFADAVAAAARTLRESRLPLVTGLRTDVAGTSAALALAKAAGGVIDHDGSAALYRTTEVLRSFGLFRGVPAELRRRSDRILLVGSDAAETAPGLLAYLLSGPVDLGRGVGARRAVVWLGAGAGASLAAGDFDLTPIACEPARICGAVGAIRASLAGRRFDETAPHAAKAAELAAWLGGASFATVAWSTAGLDTLSVEMLAGLVTDLNGPTRASAIPLGAPDGAAGAAEVATWTAGYPLRIGFAGGEADHDPWRFDGARLLASGECDLVVHISALEGAPAANGNGEAGPGIRIVSIVNGTMARAAIAFETGVAGRDHAGALFEDRIASFVPFQPDRPGEAPSAAEVLRAITDALLGLGTAERAA